MLQSGRASEEAIVEGTPDLTAGSVAFSVSDYAGRLQRAARRLEETGPESWRGTVEQGLAEAYRQNDAVGLASMVQVIVGFLDAEGRFGDAVAEVGHALALAHNDPAAVAILEAMRACFLLAMGDLPAALKSIEAAELAQAQTQLPAAIRKSRSMIASGRLRAFAADDLAQVEDLMALAPEDVLDSDRLFLMSTYVPYRFALGERAAAHPWTRSFRLAAEAGGHQYRIGDAATFERAEAAIRRPLESPSLDGIPDWNSLARSRLLAVRFRAALLQRDLAAANDELEALGRVCLRAGMISPESCDPFRALLTAVDGGGVALQLPAPTGIHLGNLGAVLAGAEAVGIAGSQAEAVSWHEWLVNSMPARIMTSLEWPVSRLRIQGLVALRAGDMRAARRDIEQAIGWAEGANYPIERALAQVQLAELLQHHAAAINESKWRALREQGWKALRAAGIDPAPHAYVVAQSRSAKLTLTLQPLTPREAEVLSLLAEGLTYKSIALRLGIKWPTVQALAHRCYDKLEASGRVRAVQAARELGIL